MAFGACDWPSLFPPKQLSVAQDGVRNRYDSFLFQAPVSVLRFMRLGSGSRAIELDEFAVLGVAAKDMGLGPRGGQAHALATLPTRAISRATDRKSVV